MKASASAGIILVLLVSVAAGQGNAELDQLNEKIGSHLESAFPGWKHRRVTPFWPSSKILVQVWCSPAHVNVKVDVTVRDSEEDAKKELHSFLEFRKEPQELKGFGDEAFFPERNGRDIVLRRGRYVIYLNMVTLSGENGVEASQSEVQKIGIEFAKQLSSVELQ